MGKRSNSIFITILLLTAVWQLHGQDSIRRFKFIHYDLNRLLFAKDSGELEHLYDKLSGLKKGRNDRITIVHIGGSHVQGGTWSNSFVSAFQSEYKTPGGGYFVFPYRVGKTNGQPFASSFSTGKWKLCRPFGKGFCVPLGLSALSVSTLDSSAMFGVALRDRAVCKYVNVVKVYHNFSPGYIFTLNKVDSYAVKRKDFKREGYTRFEFTMLVDSISFHVVRTDTGSTFTLFGLSLENNLAPGFYLAALGANGAASASFLRCEDFETRIATLEPDLYILSLGVNDTQAKGFLKEDYIEHYDSLITMIRKASPHAGIILTTTTDNYIKRRTSNKRTVKAQEAMLELRDKHNVAVWDLFAIMGGYKSMTQWYKAGLAARDKIHFTARGYNIVGNMMYQAVRKSFENYTGSSH